MARHLLASFLLLLALCWAGETADVCGTGSYYIGPSWDCINKVMNDKRHKLKQRIDDLRYSTSFNSTPTSSSSLVISFTSIRAPHVFEIQLGTVDIGNGQLSSIACKWNPAFAVEMEANLQLCDGLSTKHASCRDFSAKATIFDVSKAFTKPWAFPGKQRSHGTVKPWSKFTRIFLDTSELTDWSVWHKTMKTAVSEDFEEMALKAFDEFMPKLKAELDAWFNNDVIPAANINVQD